MKFKAMFVACACALAVFAVGCAAPSATGSALEESASKSAGAAQEASTAAPTAVPGETAEKSAEPAGSNNVCHFPTLSPSAGSAEASASKASGQTAMYYVKYAGGKLSIDDIVWVSNGDTEAMKKYGLTEDDMDDDFAIVDEDPTYKDASLASDAEFGVIDDGASVTKSVDLEGFAAYMEQRSEGIIANVTILEGKVTKIDEVYTP